MSFRVSAVRCALLMAAVASLSGCMFTGDKQLDEVRSDPSPDLDTLHQRPADVDNAMVVTFDENGRMFWEDMGRLWLTDRPSRLTREPSLRP
jgi:hypothetical protein